jgi:ribosome-associated protein
MQVPSTSAAPIEPVDGVYVTPRGRRLAAESVSWVATRSGGPGGQHANTSDTAVTVSIDVALTGLPDVVRARHCRGRPGGHGDIRQVQIAVAQPPAGLAGGAGTARRRGRSSAAAACSHQAQPRRPRGASARQEGGRRTQGRSPAAPPTTTDRAPPARPCNANEPPPERGHVTSAVALSCVRPGGQVVVLCSATRIRSSAFFEVKAWMTAGDREQEEHDGGGEAHPGGLPGPLTEDAEPVGGEQQAAEGVGSQQGVDSQALEAVRLGLQFVDLFLGCAGFLGGGHCVAGFGDDRPDRGVRVADTVDDARLSCVQLDERARRSTRPACP